MTPHPYPNDDPAGVFANPAGFSYDATRGYFKNTDTWADAPRTMLLPSGVSNLSAVRKVTANVTGYFNTPESCLGRNMLYIDLDNGDRYILGTDDWWGLDDYGQNIYRGLTLNAPDCTECQEDVINEAMEFIVPPGRTITALSLKSDNLSGWAAANRGQKDITLWTPVVRRFHGTITDKDGNPAERRITVLDATGHCVATDTSDPVTGAYSITVPAESPYTLVFDGEPDRNAQVFANVIPGESPA